MSLLLFNDAIAPGDPIAPGFAPSDINGAIFWGDGSDEATLVDTNNVVTSWADKSTAGNDATAVSKPIVREQLLNNRAAIEYDGASYFTLPSAVTNALSFTSDWTVAIAFKRDTTNDGFLLCSAISGSDRMAIHMNTVLRCGMYDGAFVSVSENFTDTDNPHILIMENRNSTVTAWLDGVALTGSATPVTTGVAGTWIGARNGANLLDGMIGEIVIYDNAISAADRGELETYLTDKWIGAVGTNLRVAASRSSFQHRTVNSADDTMNAVIRHEAPTDHDLIGLRLVFPNVSISGGEQTPANAITVSAAIDDGSTVTQATFGGATSISVPAGSYVISDRLDITIPRNTTFYERVHVAWSGDLHTSRYLDNAHGDALESGTGLADKSVSGAITHNDGDAYTACAILAYSAQGRQPSVLILGDSIAVGQSDGFDAEGNHGYMERVLGAEGIAYINGGNAADTAQQNAASGALDLRAELGNRYCERAWIQYSVNDIRAGRTFAQLEADLGTIAGQLTIPCYQSTMTPDETGGLGTGTSADTDFSVTERTSFNTNVRATLSGFAGFIDAGLAAETALNSNSWKASYSSDGLHPVSLGAAGIATDIASEVASQLK